MGWSSGGISYRDERKRSTITTILVNTLRINTDSTSNASMACSLLESLPNSYSPSRQESVQQLQNRHPDN